MADTYKITLSDGRVVTVQADHQPTEAEIHAAMGTPQATAPEQDFLTRNAPTIGGIAGGIGGAVVGGFPGALAGSTAGGALGEAYRISQEPKPVDPLTATLRMGTEGAGQGVATLAGEGLGLAAKAAARPLMSVAANATARLSAEFPGLSQTLIDNALTVTKGGLNEAKALLSKASAATRALLSQADAAGVQIPITAATDGLNRTLTQAMASTNIPEALNTLARVEREVQAGRAAMLSPTEADALKSSLQKEAKQAYDLWKRTAAPGAPVPLEVTAKQHMAASLNAAIDDVMKNAGVAGYAAANGTEQGLIGAVRVLGPQGKDASQIARALLRPGAGAVLGGTLGYETGQSPSAGAFAGALLTTPGALSRMALLLSHPATRAALSQIPRPILQAIMDQQQPTEPTQTPNEILAAGRPPQ